MAVGEGRAIYRTKLPCCLLLAGTRPPPRPAGLAFRGEGQTLGLGFPWNRARSGVEQPFLTVRGAPGIQRAAPPQRRAGAAGEGGWFPEAALNHPLSPPGPGAQRSSGDPAPRAAARPPAGVSAGPALSPRGSSIRGQQLMDGSLISPSSVSRAAPPPARGSPYFLAR